MKNALDVLSPSDAVIIKERGYVLSTVVGKGSYAKVLRAEHVTENGRIYLACKCINKSEAPADFVKKFLPRELDTLSKLKHPHIIHVHAIYQKDAKYFIFMRFAEKGDLLSLVMEQGPLSESITRTWSWQLALALQYMHVSNIVHRDIKLDNILITKNFNVKLSDFGFARSILDFRGNIVLSETYCGSLKYTAPEIIKGYPYDPRLADVWSFGVVLFAMANQRMPFPDETLAKLYEYQMNRQFRYRSEVMSEISSAMKGLINNMLNPMVNTRINIHDVISSQWFEGLRMTPEEDLALNKAVVLASKEVAMLKAQASTLQKPLTKKSDLKKVLVVLKEPMEETYYSTPNEISVSMYLKKNSTKQSRQRSVPEEQVVVHKREKKVEEKAK